MIQVKFRRLRVDNITKLQPCHQEMRAISVTPEATRVAPGCRTSVCYWAVQPPSTTISLPVM